MNKLVMGGAAALTTIGIGIGAVQLANADTTTPTPSEPAAVSKDSAAEHGKRAQGPRARGVDPAALAEKLGVDETAVTEAIQAVRQEQTPRDGAAPSEEDRATRHAAFVKALAEKLGIDEATVTSALDELKAAAQADRAAADKAVLDQAVADGTLTQAEADAVAKAVDAGIAGIRGPRK